MEHSFCPGARFLRQPKPELFTCPNCGEEVEIWSDEVHGSCPKCKRTVFREGHMSCLQWCKYAQECVGQDLYDSYMKNRAVGLRRKLLEEVKSCLKAKPERVRHCEKVLYWAEKILKTEKADWHIVIPASILTNTRLASDIESSGQRAGEILLRSGFTVAEIERISAIVDHRPDKRENTDYRVVHDAELLAHLEEGEFNNGEFLTATGKKLAERRFLRKTSV
jgi:hypothetical protein